MTLEEFWAEVEKLKDLLGMEINQLPSSLFLQRQTIDKKRPEETAELLDATIDEVNRGSVESIDSLVRRRL